MTWPFGDLRPLSFSLIAADPPWEYELYSEAGNQKSASAQYDTMPLEEIMALPVGHLASGDCLLLLWGCGWMEPRLRQAVMESWGFAYKSEMAWRKTTRKGKVRMGPGYRVRTMHEPIYLGVMGNPEHKPFPSLFDGVARQHSRKPEEFYSLVDRCSPNSTKLDLFSRQKRRGWENWGREATKFDTGDPVSMRRDRPAPEQRAPEPMTLFTDNAA
ncbi:DNA methyltransferase [Mesorhizobium sp. L-8-10]|uniref:MT-A70 family methyltransferase n=1 Tax=Mesorhizobium sp. L-8-10 TaxID=2744523 RepID=UPI001928D3C9|nr:MT-A70 family methyltransferase [Mesorhizobium sp. L-8-10]BCH33231.1 DNA methyltransferase [Mesorhizobium sp. L-8-10]